MVGMAYMSGAKAARSQEALSNRGIESGGNVGGSKNAGFGLMVSMRPYNIGYTAMARVPHTGYSVQFALRNTTRNPVQQRRNGNSIIGNSGLG